MHAKGSSCVSQGYLRALTNAKSRRLIGGWSAVDRVEPSQFSQTAATPPDAPKAANSPVGDVSDLPVEWVLSRNQVDKVLDLGPGAFLSTVEVRASFTGQRFAGWEIVALTGNLGRVVTPVQRRHRTIERGNGDL